VLGREGLNLNAELLNDIDMLAPRHTVSQAHVQLSAARPVRCESRRLDDRSIEAHAHDYFEVFVVQDGSARHVTADYALVAQAGTVGVLAPGEIHALVDCRGLVVTNIYYLAEWLLHEVSGTADRDHLRSLFLEPALYAPRNGRVIPHLSLDDDELASVDGELSGISRESSLPAPSHVYLRAALLKCMVVIARAYSRRGAPTDAHLRDEAWAVMQECEKAVAAGGTVDLTAVAARFSITADHLRRIFRLCTGLSPSGYFARRRVLAAAARLLDPSAGVTGVAVDLGYSDTAHLSRHFRRELGLSPREYRRRYRVSE
jgi:AraC-like DNA-binding protein